MLQFCAYPNNDVVFIVAAHVSGVRGRMVNDVLAEDYCDVWTGDMYWRVRGSAAEAQLRVATAMMMA